MISPKSFYNELESNGISFFSGVPDSLLKDICAYISDNVPADRHIIAANEGASVGLGVGYNLASKKVPLIYMQNSGFGNTVNPLLSIADPDVYSIPMVLLIGWRGEPNTKDEPQHLKQGKVSEDLLKVMGIPYEVLGPSSDYISLIKRAVYVAKMESRPFAILVKSDTFEKYKLKNDVKPIFPLNREGAVKQVIDLLEEDDIVVSTTGKTSREVFEHRVEKGQGQEKDFLTVGGMGHTSSIAMGIAIEKRGRRVYCLDGDGSLIMHMGSLGINGQMDQINNFKHIVFNNGAHDSVGGQPTVGFALDLVTIAKACGYTFVASASTAEEISMRLNQVRLHEGRAFLEIKISKGAREDLGRPTTTPIQNKIAFQDFLE